MQKRGWLVGVVAVLWLIPATVLGSGLELVSRSSFGEQGNGASQEPAISADGRFVAFTSDASNLVDNDPGSWYWQTDPDIFILDRIAGTVENASRSLNSAGLWYMKTVCRKPTLAGSGEMAAFACFSGYHQANNMQFDIYLYNRRSGSMKLVTPGLTGQKANSGSSDAKLSADGATLAFTSTASNLHAADLDNVADVYLYDVKNSLLELATVGTGGAKGDGPSGEAALSSDGRYLAFASAAGNLVEGDDNGVADIFRLDRQDGTLQRFAAPDGASCAEPVVSGDGAVLAFSTLAANGSQSVYLVTHGGGAPVRVDTGSEPALSADGHFLAYVAPLPGAPGRSMVLRRDLVNGQREVVSVTAQETPGDGVASAPALSAHGAELVFASTAGDLVDGDGNATVDVFLAAAVADTTPPNVALTLSSKQLWPPNKKMVPVQVDGWAEDDRELASVEITVSDEYGSMINQIVPGFGSTVWLEAWRDGNDSDGRIYTITAVAVDAAGNRSEQKATVLVPHDMRADPSPARR
jgi:Tol biopolymer transport system component